MKKTIVLFLLLSSSLVHAQDYFNNYMLDLMDQVAKKEKINSVKKLLSKNDFQLKEVEDNSSGGKRTIFKIQVIILELCIIQMIGLLLLLQVHLHSNFIN